MSGQTRNNVESLSFPSSLRTITPSFPSGWKSISRLSPTAIPPPHLPAQAYQQQNQNQSNFPPPPVTSLIPCSSLTPSSPISSSSSSSSSLSSSSSQAQSPLIQQQQTPTQKISSQQMPIVTTVATAVADQSQCDNKMDIMLYPIDKLALCDSKRNLRFVPILSSAEATKQGEMNLIIDVKTLPTPSYVVDAAKLGYFFICSKSGKCVTVKDNLTLLICSDPTNINDVNGICKYVSFSQIYNEHDM